MAAHRPVKVVALLFFMEDEINSGKLPPTRANGRVIKLLMYIRAY